jgi:type II secretory pathway component PulF
MLRFIATIGLVTLGGISSLMQPTLFLAAAVAVGTVALAMALNR